MTKGVKICLAAIITVFLAAVIITAVMSLRTGRNMAVIEQNGERLYRSDLDKEEDREFTVTSPDGGWNTIRIQGGTICVSEADCPDKTCVRTGILRNEGSPIVCLPHKLIIRFADENGG